VGVGVSDGGGEGGKRRVIGAGRKYHHRHFEQGHITRPLTTRKIAIGAGSTSFISFLLIKMSRLPPKKGKKKAPVIDFSSVQAALVSSSFDYEGWMTGASRLRRGAEVLLPTHLFLAR
jgi:hypothetical protein